MESSNLAIVIISLLLICLMPFNVYKCVLLKDVLKIDYILLFLLLISSIFDDGIVCVLSVVLMICLVQYKIDLTRA